MQPMLVAAAHCSQRPAAWPARADVTALRGRSADRHWRSDETERRVLVLPGTRNTCVWRHESRHAGGNSVGRCFRCRCRCCRCCGGARGMPWAVTAAQHLHVQRAKKVADGKWPLPPAQSTVLARRDGMDDGLAPGRVHGRQRGCLAGIRCDRGPGQAGRPAR